MARLYFQVGDIRAAVARVRDLGGHAGEPEKAPYGWGAECRDDQGGAFGLLQLGAGA